MKRKAIGAIVAASLAAAITTPAMSAGNEVFIAKQSAGQWTANTLIGQPVKNAKGDALGDVNDLVFGQDSKLVAIVVGVGGFLGIGEKNIAIPVALTQIEGSKTSDAALRVKISKAALKDAPQYQPLKGVGVGTVDKLFQQAKDVGASVSEAATKAVEKGTELGQKAADEATKLKNNVTGEQKKVQ